MKKIALIVLALLVVAAVALPPVVGTVTEKALRAQLDMSLADNPYVETRLVDYQRGYRTSTGKATVTLAKAYRDALAADADTPEARQRILDGTDATIPLDIEIEHGPVVFNNGFGLALSDQVTTLGESELLDELRELVGTDEIMRLTSRTSLTSSTRFDLNLVPFEVTQAGDTMRFSGLRADGRYAPGSRKLEMNGVAESLAVEGSEGTVTLNGLTFDIDTTLVEGNSLGLGTSGMRIERVAMSGFDGDATSVAMDGFSLVSEIARGTDERYLTVGAEYRIDSVSVPGYKVSNLSVPMSAAQVDFAAMQRYQRVMANFTPDSDPEDMLTQMTETVHAVFAGGPTLKIGPATVDVNGDRFDFNLDVITKDDALPDLAAFDMGNPGMWLGLFRADATLNIDQKLVDLVADSVLADQIQASLPPDAAYTQDQIDEIVAQQKEMMIGQFVDQGFVTLKDNRYSTTANYNDGELLINGTPFPLEALMGP